MTHRGRLPRYPLNAEPDIGPRFALPNLPAGAAGSGRTTRGKDAMNAKESPFLTRLDAVAAETQALLDRLLAGAPAEGELSRPARLIEAMRYSSLGGGKRFRPFLVVESASLFDVPRQNALMAGAALECVHCYSLVHDDLPAMDNDALRRGQPTAHKKFDEATAILAGDGLLTFAFDILSRPQTHADPGVRIALINALARAAGLGGMVGGQMLDLAAEGRFGAQHPGTQHHGANDVRLLQAMKTGALLRFACQAGGILAAATPAQREALERYGAAVGEAFQIADDLLDIEGDPSLLGKATGKDAAAGKATFVSVLGLTGAKARLSELVTAAEKALAPFGSAAAILIQGAHFVADRHA
jgi:farnesyl diphosphate synthase